MSDAGKKLAIVENVIILGSGRSGTSMVAGLLANSGYFMGDGLLDPDEKNPKGYFEDKTVNRINEDVLERVALRRPRIIGKLFFRHRPLRFQRWLAVVPERVDVAPNPRLLERMAPLLRREPYCFKDPRFCYTLAAWRPLLDKTKFLCVFRDPGTTADSILKVCAADPALHSMSLRFGQALDVWASMYTHVLKKHRLHGEWVFLHYDQVFTESGLVRVERLLECTVDRSFPERRLNRTVGRSNRVPAGVERLYRALCDLAQFDPRNGS